MTQETREIAVSLDVDPSIEEVVLFYQSSLDAMLVPEGELPRSLEGKGRPLPVPDSTQRLELPGLGVKTEIDDPSEVVSSALFRAFLLPAPTVNDCVRGGGCYPNDLGACEAPCPVAPMPAEAQRPELPRFECGSWARKPLKALGITNARLENLEICEAGPTLNCPEGQASLPGRGCVEVLTPCTEWPPNVDETAIFVHPGAVDGDGSRARPFASLREALQAGAGSEREVVALGPGLLADQESLQLPSDMEIRGCGTILGGTLTVGPGHTLLSNLQWAPGSHLVVPPEAEVDITGAVFAPDRSPAPRLTVAGVARVTNAVLELGQGRIAVVSTPGDLRLEHAQVSSENGIAVSQGARFAATEVRFIARPIGALPALFDVRGAASFENAVLELHDGAEKALIDASQTASVSLYRAALTAIDGQGVGLRIREEADVHLWSTSVMNMALAIEVLDQGRTRAEDVFVGNVASAVSGKGQARIELRRSTIARPKGIGTGIRGDTTLVLEDVMSVGGIGALSASERSLYDIRRVLIADTLLFGIDSTSRHTTQNLLVDVTTENVKATSLVVHDFGALLRETFLTRFRVIRLTIRNGQGIGAWIAVGSEANLTDIRVEGVTPVDNETCQTARMLFEGYAICSGEGIRFGTLTRGGSRLFPFKAWRAG